MKKRILSVCLCLILVSGGVLSNIGTLKTKAASAPAVPIPIDSELYCEMLMALYSVLETGMIASGAKEGLNEIESAQSLSEAFFAFMDTFSDAVVGELPGSSPCDIEFVTEDGQTISLDSGTYQWILDDGTTIDISNEQLQEALWTGTITLDPETETDDVIVSDETWQEFLTRLNTKLAMNNKYGPNGEYWPGGNGGDDQDPEDSLFTKIKNVTIGAGIVTAVGAFVSDLFNGETDLEPATYYTGLDYMYSGRVPQDADGYYLYRGVVYRNSGYFTCYINTDSICKIVGYLDNSFMFLGHFNVDGNFDGDKIIRQKWDSDPISNAFNDSYVDSYNVNFPLFSSKEDALSYAETGDDSAALNAPKYEYEDMAEEVPTILAPITNVKFSPNEMTGMNAALKKAAYNFTETDTSTDPETRTQAYTQTMTNTMQEVAPATGTGTQPGTGTGDGTDTDTGAEMEAEGYKVDLTMIFPFCLPFDLIAFFEALSAEPVTPVFEFPFVVPALDYNENVTIDLSIFDGVMEIFRLGELGCFIIMLIYATSKLIKW